PVLHAMALAATPGGGPLNARPQCFCAHSYSRKTLCISYPPQPDHVLQQDDPDFIEQVARFYTPEESLAADRLIDLKTQLETAKGDTFWTTITEGMAQLSGAQYAFVSKRMDHDD